MPGLMNRFALFALVAFLQAPLPCATAGIGYGATGTSPLTRVTDLPKPIHPGPRQDVATGAHPPFQFPPAEAAAAAVVCKTVQYSFPAGTNSDPYRADAVRDLYRLSWDQYAQYCFGHDQINVLDNTCEDDIFGWGATIVDGIDTAIIMNLTDIVTKQLAFVAQIDFRYSRRPHPFGSTRSFLTPCLIARPTRS